MILKRICDNMFKISIKKYGTIQSLFIYGFLITVISNWAYGNSYLLYSIASLSIAAYAYLFFFLNIKKKESFKMRMLMLFLIFVNFLVALWHGDLKSSFLTNISLIMPFTLSFKYYSYTDIEKQIIRASLFCLGIVLLIVLFLGENWNSSSLGIMITIGTSVGYLWLILAKTIKSKIFASLYLFVSALFVFNTQTRNSALILMLIYVLLIIPKKFYQNTYFFRIIYIVAIVSTIIAPTIMEFVFNNPSLLNFITDFTTSISDKTYGMSSHLDVILYVQSCFNHFDIFTKIFGEAVKEYHSHNLYYQCLVFYGYFGTIIIYSFYIYLFEIGYKLFKKYNDKVALGCCIILISHFFMQCAEVYMHGLETTFVAVAIPAALIMNLNRKYKNFNKNTKF